MQVEIQTTLKIELDLPTVAKWFAHLDDDAQAQFFVEVDKVADTWPDKGMGKDYQWYAVGSHLKSCKCSTDGARDMIRAIHDGLETGTHT